MKRYFLGMAEGYSRRGEVWKHIFATGGEKDCENLRQFLTKKYGGEAILTKNGRSGLALALEAYFDKGDKILVNGFTCFAVFEAVKAAGMKPVFVDIEKNDLNFSIKTLEAGLEPGVKGMIVQNSLGNPVEMKKIEQFAKKHELVIIEDLAHCTGLKYPDGREAGTVGAATALSFGKDKAIDTITGGAVILRAEPRHQVASPDRAPKAADSLRARFYPLFGLMARKLTAVHLGGGLMRILVRMHWVEKSADNRLDKTQKIAGFEAKLALGQLKEAGKLVWPLRKFYLVRDREEVLKKLQRAGYYLGGLWYEKPISPARYYKKTRFPEEKCPNAVAVAESIINLPNYYSKREMKKADEIIKPYKIEEGENVKN